MVAVPDELNRWKQELLARQRERHERREQKRHDRELKRIINDFLHGR